MIEVATLVGPAWNWPIDWNALADEAVLTAVRVSGQSQVEDAPGAFEISVKFADDEEVRALNAAYRGKQVPTNVLSFPMMSAAELARPAVQGGLLGDIVLAAEVCEREAREKDILVADHARHLIVHGTLHLLGHDHEDDGNAESMEGIERAALASIGVADPYTEGSR